MGHKTTDITGKIFGDFIVIKKALKDGARHLKWELSCTHCGRTRNVALCNLRRHDNPSCLCQRGKNNSAKSRFAGRRKQKIVFTPTHEYIEDAVGVYLKRGGRITKCENGQSGINLAKEPIGSILDKDFNEFTSFNNYTNPVSMVVFRGRF